MERRHELSDEEWARLAHHFAPARTGRPPGDYRQRVSAVLWILRTGAPWRDLPERCGPWQTVYSSFARWTANGTWAAVADALLLETGRAGKIDHRLWCVDGSVSRAHRAAAGARHPKGLSGEESKKAQALGRSRGGLTTKLHLVCDRNGIPLAASISPGQTHESVCFETTLSALPLDAAPQALAGDKGYSVLRIRAWIAARGITDVIPYKKSEHPPEGHVFDRETYRARNVVERLIGWLKENRRIATRFEKLGRNFLAMLRLAAIRRLLRIAQ